MTHNLGSIVKSRRLNLGITQTQLAEKSGYSLDTINAFENDRRNVGIDTVLDIFNVLGLKLVVKEEEGDDNKFRNDSTSPKRKTGLIEA